MALAYQVAGGARMSRGSRLTFWRDVNLFEGENDLRLKLDAAKIKIRLKQNLSWSGISLSYEWSDGRATIGKGHFRETVATDFSVVAVVPAGRIEIYSNAVGDRKLLHALYVGPGEEVELDLSL